MIDPTEFGKAMGAIVRDATAPLLARIESLEKALSERPAAAETPPIDVESIAKSAASLIPVPKDGESVDIEDVMSALVSHADEYLKSIPIPKDGVDGKDAVAPSVDEIAATFERRFSDLTLSWERQARNVFEKAADRMPIPKDGENGRDAFPLDSFDMQLGDDGRTVTVKMQAGDTVIEKSVKIATLLDKGVYSKGHSYEKGDVVSYGGCSWVAQKDDAAGVPGGSDGWRLSVKKGRDGKDLRENSSKRDPKEPVNIRGDRP